MRSIKLFAFVALLLACSQRSVAPSKVGVAATPPPGRVIGFDPSAVGLPGAIGDTVYDAAGVISWIKYGASNTAWRPVPVSQMVTGDPSQAPGLKAPIGFVVTMTDGSASWVKKTSSDTGWVTNPSAGGISTVTVIDGGGILGNGSPDAGLSAVAQNGPHVVIKQANASGIMTVTEDIQNTFTSNTNGSESAQTVISVPVTGTLTPVLSVNGTTMTVPAGVYTGVPSTTFPGISLGDGKTGIEKFGSNGMSVSDSSGNVPVVFDMQGPSGSGEVLISSSFATVVFGSDCKVDRSVDHTAAVAVLEALPNFGGTQTAFEIGPPGALATNAVGATLGITTTPGKPTFTPYYTTGHAPMIYDTTDNELCMYNPTGTPGWKCSAAFPN